MLPSNTWNTNIYNKNLAFNKKNFIRMITWGLKINFVQFPNHSRISPASYRE